MAITYNESGKTYSESSYSYVGDLIGSLTKVLTETITLSEVFLKSTVKTIANSITLAEAISNIKGQFRTLTDAITVTETIAKSLIRLIANSITLAEARLNETVKSIIDSITLSEVFSRVGTFLRTLTDSIILSERLQRYLNGVLLIWESITRVTGTVYTSIARTASSTYTSITRTASSIWTKRDRPND